MKRGMPSGAQTPDGIIFLLALIFSKAPPRYPPHHGAHWAYTYQNDYSDRVDNGSDFIPKNAKKQKKTPPKGAKSKGYTALAKKTFSFDRL